MKRYSPSALLESLREIVPAQAKGALCIAYSGGLDSSVLLHSLAELVARGAPYRLRAVHVDHRLQADSSKWREHCVRTAREAGIECTALSVEVPAADGAGGLESAARKARYEALRKELRPDEVLLTAHHADDQLETMLLALVRGAGVRGLSAMPALQAFPPGWHARPLLPFSRAELETWARERGLSWIDDPSNEHVGFDRNYLRHQVVPALRERWPSVMHSAVRSAMHLGEAGRLLDSLAEADARAALVGPCLRVPALKALEPERRRNLLRYWIKQQGVRAPSSRKLAAIEHDMLSAGEDREPCVEWDDAQMRRHAGLLYCIPLQSGLPEGLELKWPEGEALELPARLGRLRVVAAHAGLAHEKLSWPLTVRFRRGGERFRPAGDAHHRALKKLLQSSRVLPWWRERLPLVYSAGQLAAVADLWVAQEYAASEGERAVAIVWENKPAIVAQADNR
jgi:tRNA(Ile)-lysidine synthase